MIKHISLYKLKDKANIEFAKEALREVGSNETIIENNVYVSFNDNLPNVKDPIFADVMHEAIFKDEMDASKYPLSKEHSTLFEKTKGMFESVTVFDYQYK